MPASVKALGKKPGWGYTGIALGSPLSPLMGRIACLILLLVAEVASTPASASPPLRATAHLSASAATSKRGSQKKTHAKTVRQASRPVVRAARRNARRATERGPARKRQPVGKPAEAFSAKRSRPESATEAKVPATDAEVPATQADVPAADPPVPAGGERSSSHRAIARTASLHRGRFAMPLPPPLRGSFESLARQNEMLEAEGLERIEDEDDLADRIARKMLVAVPASAALTVNGNLPANHRYCRPWTARFAADLARMHQALFHRPLEVSSAVRTVEYQKLLMGTNGNAAAAEGDIVSPHLTGATIDIAKTGLSLQETGWMRSWLLPLQQAGKIDVEEEFQQACFHITVYKSYLPPRPVRKAGQRKPAQPGAGPQKAQPHPPATAAQMALRGE